MNSIIAVLREHLPKHLITSKLLDDLRKVHSGPTEATEPTRTTGCLTAKRSTIEAAGSSTRPLPARKPLSQPGGWDTCNVCGRRHRSIFAIKRCRRKR